MSHQPLRMKKTIHLILLIILISSSLQAQQVHYGCKALKGKKSFKKGNPIKNEADNSRSDTFDILHYNVYLDFTDFGSQELDGHCTIGFQALETGIDYIQLDLLELNIDSIVMDGSPLAFSYNDTLIHVNFAQTLSTGETNHLTVYYNGHPPTDPSGWGGFHWTSSYAFNLGVGFAADPHNFGRAWHPCFDNFVERATYEFNLVTAGTKTSAANGILASETVLSGDTIQRQWIMSDPIPSYLACVAIADYTTVEYSHPGISSNIPVRLTGLAEDTTNLKNSFINLGGAIDAMEYWFGEHRWDKIGYVLTTVGAMEHPTCISYPFQIANGSLGWEDIMAHELGHHWWGDLVTCETAEDMWINEGMAEYCSHLFFEEVYGREVYDQLVLQNHLDVMHYAHLQEGGFRAISGVPHSLTYGSHVYNKGAAMGHNLRSYLTDDQFRFGMQSLINDFEFSDLNSYEMRDHLTLITGIDMTPFFNDWVLSPGYSTFVFESMEVTNPVPVYSVEIQLSQYLRGAPNYHTDVPIHFTFYDNDWTTFKVRKILTGQNPTAGFQLPFLPVMVAVNEDNDLNMASTGETLKLTETGFHATTLGKMQIIIDEIQDSALLRIDHHWVAPDPIQNNPFGYQISSSRFWTVTGDKLENMNADARIFYDGREIMGGGSGFLDNDLTTSSEDSLILLHRPDATSDWQLYPYFTINNLGSTSDAFGMFILDSLSTGQYTVAKGAIATSIESPASSQPSTIKLYPNPVNQLVNFEPPEASGHDLHIVVNDLMGRFIKQEMVQNTNRLSIDVSDLTQGLYLLTILDLNGATLGSGKFTILR